MHNELRVHGVSGTPPRDMLYTDPVTESTLDDYTKIYRIPAVEEGYDPEAGAFHWGGLTAGNWHTAFWILLAPFALANVAGWLVSKRNRASVVFVRLGALALTALFASQFLHVAVVTHGWILGQDLPGWAQRLGTVVTFGALVSFVFWITGVLSIRSHFTPMRFWCRLKVLLWPSPIWLQQPKAGRPCEPGTAPHRWRAEDWSDPALAGLDDGSPWVADPRLWAPHSIVHRTRRCHFALGMAILSVGMAAGMGLPTWMFGSGVVLLVTAVLALVSTSVAARRPWVVIMTAWLTPIAFVHAVAITAMTAFTDVPRYWPTVHWTNLAISVAFGIVSTLALLSGAGKSVGALALGAFFGGALGIAAVTVLEQFAGTPIDETAQENGAGWVAVWMLIVVLTLLFVASLASLKRIEPEPAPRPKAKSRWQARGLERDEKEKLTRDRAEAQRREVFIRVRRVVHRAGGLLWASVAVGAGAAIGLAMFLCPGAACDPSNLVADTWSYLIAAPIVAGIALAIALWPLGGWIRFVVPAVGVAAILAWWAKILDPESTFFTVRFLSFEANMTHLVDAALAIAVLIPAVWMLRSIVGGVRDGEKRRKTGLLWDVASFWPRYFHPLSPPPYGPNAVTDLTSELQGQTVTLSAHSQGTVVAIVALSQLDPTEAAGVRGVITYGSPLRLIYSRLFRQAGLDELLTSKAGHSGLTWHNLWRRSDYLGGLPLPLPNESNANFEADGIGHSWYECTRQFRQLKAGAVPVAPGDESVKCGARPG